MQQQNITLRSIFIFWMPLAFTWLMMSLEGPFLSAIIARMHGAKYNLAAYGVAFSLALIIEAPIIMLLSASVALVRDRLSLRKLFRFSCLLNALITSVMLLLALPPVFSLLGKNLMGLPHQINFLANGATAILLPWPAAIGFRRFYQGILISQDKTRLVALGTVIRLSCMGLSGISLFTLDILPGAWVGAASLSIGVCSEALASRIMVHSSLKRLKSINLEDGASLTYKKIFLFYYPLALTLILSLGAHPLVTFFMGHSRMPVESLAVLPVMNAFIFVFRSFGLAYQEVVIALSGDRFENYRPMKNYALALASGITCIMLLVVSTPLVNIWYHSISGLSMELTRFAHLPTLMIFLLPALEVYFSLQRGSLILGRYTFPVTLATIIELLGVLLVLLTCIHVLDMIGVVAAALAYTTGRLGANLFLLLPNHRLKKSILSSSFSAT